MENKSLKDVDHILAYACIAIALPISGIFFLAFDIHDVLTYFSFTLASWGAIYAGRGVFSLLHNSNNPITNQHKNCCAETKSSTTLPSTEMQDHAQHSFWTGLMFIILAAITLIPTMFRAYNEVKFICILLALSINSIGLVKFGIKGINTDGKKVFFRVFTCVSAIITLLFFVLLGIYLLIKK